MQRRRNRSASPPIIPGPASAAEHPRDYADRVLGGLPEAVIGKLVHGNAAAVYHL